MPMPIRMRGNCTYCKLINIPVFCPIADSETPPLFRGLACAPCIRANKVKFSNQRQGLALVNRLARELRGGDAASGDRLAEVIDLASARRARRHGKR